MNETYLWFRVNDFGDDPSVVTEILGLPPSKAWRTGDEIAAGRGRHPYARWELASPLANAATAEDQIDALLDLLEARGDRVRQAAERFGAGIGCAVYTHHANPGFHLAAGALARVAALGLSFDYDLYCLGPAMDTHTDDARPGP